MQRYLLHFLNKVEVVKTNVLLPSIIYKKHPSYPGKYFLTINQPDFDVYYRLLEIKAKHQFKGKAKKENKHIRLYELFHKKYIRKQTDIIVLTPIKNMVTFICLTDLKKIDLI